MDTTKLPETSEKHLERSRAECTADAIFLFQVRRVVVMHIPDGENDDCHRLEHDGEGFHLVFEKPDGGLVPVDDTYLSDDDLLRVSASEEFGDRFAVEMWDTERVFLDRGEAEAWERQNHHNYGGRNKNWRVYSVPATGQLALLLRRQDEVLVV